jgi:hypothetical protein
MDSGLTWPAASAGVSRRRAASQQGGAAGMLPLARRRLRGALPGIRVRWILVLLPLCSRWCDHSWLLLDLEITGRGAAPEICAEYSRLATY